MFLSDIPKEAEKDVCQPPSKEGTPKVSKRKHQNGNKPKVHKKQIKNFLPEETTDSLSSRMDLNKDKNTVTYVNTILDFMLNASYCAIYQH
jgi:hypothetical protein